MRVSILAVIVVVVAGCSFRPSIGDDDDTPTETITLRDDTAADFADPAELIDGRIAPEGTIEPHAFVVGGLRARAYATKLVDANTTFATLDTALTGVAPLGRGYRQLPDDWKALRPEGLSLASSDNFTIYYDGEVRLLAGARAVSIDADDAGLLEVTVDGTARELVDATGGRKTLDLDVAVDGWYPIRVAVGEGTGNAKLSLQIDGALDPLALRARVTDEPGLVAHLYEFGHTKLLGTAGVDGLDGAYGTGTPAFDFPAPSFGNYELRSVGQIYIDTAGSWTFDVACSDHDSARLWIDEVHVASRWSDGIVDGLPTSATLDLAVGWHDLFLDLRVIQSNVLHPATVSVQATPPGGTPAAIPAARLRPAVSSGLATATITSNRALVIDGTTDLALTFPTAATRIHALDAGYVMTGNPGDYTVQLDTGASLIGIPQQLGATGTGAIYDDTSLRGQPVPTTPWTMRFIDNVTAGLPSNVAFAAVDLVTRGGPAPPFPERVSYLSKPHATPGALELGAVRVAGAFDDATLQIFVRTAATEAELATAPLVEVTPGEVPAVAPDAFLQYQIVATSDGWQFPVIDAVEVDYVAPR